MLAHIELKVRIVNTFRWFACIFCNAFIYSQCLVNCFDESVLRTEFPYILAAKIRDSAKTRDKMSLKNA